MSVFFDGYILIANTSKIECSKMKQMSLSDFMLNGQAAVGGFLRIILISFGRLQCGIICVIFRHSANQKFKNSRCECGLLNYFK